MIDKTQLRIGNLVSIDGVTVEVGEVCDLIIYALHESFDKDVDLERVESIPLTEEWMQKLGFVGIGNNFIGGNNWWRVPISSNFNEGNMKIWITDSAIDLSHIKHVHQLQNLYFSLTGEELQLSNPSAQ